MIALLMLYPGLSAVKLVGTDLVQAVPLVLAAAISNIAINGLDWTILIPLVLGSTPGTMIGSRIAPAGAAVDHPARHRDRADDVRRGPARQVRLGAAGQGRDPPGPDRPCIGLAMLVLVPLVWGLIRKTQGLPMFGAPTVTELDAVEYGAPTTEPQSRP